MNKKQKLILHATFVERYKNKLYIIFPFSTFEMNYTIRVHFCCGSANYSNENFRLDADIRTYR